MDPANTPLGKMITEEITPVVMVLRTPLVEEACLKNGLSFIEMLTPFCSFTNIDVPVRTSSDQPYRVQKFKLRLFYESDIRQPNLEIAKERLKQVVTQVGEKENTELHSEPPQISDLLSRSESEILPPWFDFFNKELVRTVSFSDHEAFDHPVACLLVVSSKDEQPINKFVDLFNTNKLPSLLNDGAMDPKILKHYLLVHDNQDGSSESVAKVLTEMKNTFGSNDCQVLCINSSQDGPIEHQTNPWTNLKSGDMPNQHLGCFLNVDDLKEIKDVMQDLSSKHIIPYMEQKIRVLNQQVSATRKGFRNQIKNLWWRKGKEDTPDSSNGPTYTFSSIESQIRVLGDYAFLLRDYELALSSYRLISTDYKLDKAWKRYAGVQEMMGLAYFMSDQSRKEAEYCMENAFSTYLKIGSSSLQNATRCGLWWVEMLKTRGLYKDAATVYFRICNEELLHSAVMLEQASYCYLLCQPPMLHKYGFHLVLSGDRYKRCDQIKHAIRTYRSAISVYKGTTWSYIKDHVHFHIGQWYAFLGLYDVAVSHMLEVLACSHQSKTTQELFLRSFLQIVQRAGKTFEVLKLQLPVINIYSLKVIFEDHRTYGSPAVASIRESLWHSFEEEVIPSLSASRTNWLELQSKVLPKKYKESNICVAGEAVKVGVEFKNPLQIPISISGVSLMCELVASSDKLNPDGGATNSAAEVHNDEHGKVGDTELDSSFVVSQSEFSLAGGETNVAQLTVTPMVEGILTIIGIRWKLSGSVVGYYNFNSDLLRKMALKGKKKTKNSPDSELKYMVIKRLPKLEGIINGLPKMAYTGELRQLVLELKNQWEFPVKNLKMKISHPRFLNIGNREDLNTEILTCLAKDRNGTQNGNYSPKKVSDSLFQFPEDISVNGEAPLMWPLWLRAAVPGNISLYVIIYYEIEDASNVMRYRTLRMHYTLQVLPSLDVSFKITPSPSKLQEFLVLMDIVNKTSSENFRLNQLSSIGKKWEILLLQPVDTMFPSQSLNGGQALSCFFILKRLQPSAIDENGEQPTDSHPRTRNEISLVPGDCKEVLLDISRSPLVDFHRSERLQSGISNQEEGNTVDFVLIYQTLRSTLDSEASDSSNFFSHHACHCSTESRNPISWVLSGPRIAYHNFSSSFCQIDLQMTIHNSSELTASVSIDTLSYTGSTNRISETTSATVGNQAGWYDASQLTDIKVTSNVVGIGDGKSITVESVPPFIWSGCSSTKFQLDPMSSTEIPMQVCVFSPGTYDLSNYVLNWNLQSVNDQENNGETRQLSGANPGYSYFLTVLQSD